MRVDTYRFMQQVCRKCKKYTGSKPVFGKCMATKTDIYRCAGRRMREAE